MLRVGELLDNKYRILGEAGHGGMSVVYLAINERANKTWAVKEVRKDGVMDYAAVRQRLAAETDMMKKLSHPFLPSIIDVVDTRDSFIIVMDYIEGRSLLKLLESDGAQSEDRVIKWARQICDVLVYLHGQSPPVIYRDMKPANIMLKPDGNITLIDFGTAREFKNTEMAEDTTCLGTRGYAAPEQFGGKGQSDERTDIYCFGATLYHLITGHSPAEPPYEIKPISYWLPGYAGSGLEKLILKCTRQDPGERYQDCVSLKYALDHYRDEDEAVIKKRKRQIRAFFAALLTGIIALSGAVFFRCSWDAAKQDSYESRIDRAMMQDGLENAAAYFKLAMEVNAGDRLVYEKLLEKTGTEIVKDGKFTTGDTQIVSDILMTDSDGVCPNIDVLAAEDPDTYAEVMYEIGLWYFFMKDNTPEDRQNANVYFQKIKAEPYISRLKKGRRGMLLIMSRIGEYIGALNSDMSRIGSGTKSSYAELFSDLKELVAGDLRSKVGTDYFCLAVYRQTACWIYDKYRDFTGDGVSKEEMLELVGMIEKGIGSLGIGEGESNYQEYTEAVSAVNNARKTVERI